MKILYDGSKHNYNVAYPEWENMLIDLHLKIYKSLKKGNEIEVFLDGSTRKWEDYEIGEELYLDAMYRVKK